MSVSVSVAVAVSRFLTLFLLLKYCSGYPGINVPDYFEQQCSPTSGFVTQNFENWSANLTDETPLYLPMTSILDLLRLSQDLFKKADLSFLNQWDVLNSCLTLRFSQNPVFRTNFFGYCGKTVSKAPSMMSPKVFHWNKLFPEGVGGVFRISLSDNKSWQVVDVCWGDGQRSFAVISLYPQLSTCTKKIITEHLKAIGFNEKYFAELNYNHQNCNNSSCFWKKNNYNKGPSYNY